MSRMRVARFGTRAKAEPLQQRLAAAGVAAEIHDELRLAKLWFVSKPSVGVRLEVPANQWEQAQRLILDWDQSDGALREAIRCPECRSLRVDYPQFTRNSLLTNLTLGLMAELRLVEKNFYCADCHFTWPREGYRVRPNRPHLAPYYFIEGVEQTARSAGSASSKGDSDAARQKAA